MIFQDESISRSFSSVKYKLSIADLWLNAAYIDEILFCFKTGELVRFEAKVKKMVSGLLRLIHILIITLRYI